MDNLKIGKATDLEGKDRRLYRSLEILPGALSWATLLGLAAFSYWQPVWVAVFLILFDIFWLLQVVYLAIYLISSYRKMRQVMKTDWAAKCQELKPREFAIKTKEGLIKKTFVWQDVYHLVIMPTVREEEEVLRTTLHGLAKDNYPKDKMIVVLATEGRAGEEAQERAQKMQKEFGHLFRNFIITVHPGDIAGEMKGKGANQAWAAKQVKRDLIDQEGLDYDKILVSVFDIDTVIERGYFYCLTYRFFTAEDPHRSSYQPIPVYNNNIWQAPFFARIAAFSNTFWQMMLQLRQEKLATYSSHSMAWRTLVDIDFWATDMVSEDSRIFFHAFFYYKGDYRVEPLYFVVSMDACMDKSFLYSAKNLYKQQRRWGWGVENVPYIIFNTIKRWRELPKKKAAQQIFIQIYGFHSWATNALIIAGIGWLPLLIGGDRFNESVLSNNLPAITQNLMNLALVGMLLSAIISTMILPPKPPKYGFGHRIVMFVQWLFLPISIVIFGSIPGLEAQTRLMFGKYMGFWVTPKKR